ncbi:MAG TPA: response regulator [Treponemataceae bacterium]|jgi:two-component system, OmpR family, response regulator|nr:response regulator [Treponemataceae bacterium]HQL04499.1 response regulator [Treponemataceae bacterium]
MSKDSSRTIVYSALEVANICGVVNQTAINWIRNGYLQAFSTPGGQYRVYLDDLVDFMNKRKMRIPSELMDIYDQEVVNQQSVLVVDDDKGLNSVIAKYLEKSDEKIIVYQAYDGFEAGAQLVDKKPRCVLLDLDLPGVDGFDLCRRIYTSEEYGKPIVCVITALQDDDIEQKVKKMGAVEFFRKPLNLVEISEKIKERLGL